MTSERAYTHVRAAAPATTASSYCSGSGSPDDAPPGREHPAARAAKLAHLLELLDVGRAFVDGGGRTTRSIPSEVMMTRAACFRLLREEGHAHRIPTVYQTETERCEAVWQASAPTQLPLFPERRAA